MTRQRTGPSLAPVALAPLVALVVLAAAHLLSRRRRAAAGTGQPETAVRLAGAPSLPKGAAVVGPTNGAERITADVSLVPRDVAASNAFVAAVSTPGSPRSGTTWRPVSSPRRSGRPRRRSTSVRAWLASTGLRLGRTTPDGLLIPVTGTAAQMTAHVRGVAARHPAPQRTDRPLLDEHSVRAERQWPAVVQGVVGLEHRGQPQPQIVPAHGPPCAPPAPATAAAPHVGPTPSCPGHARRVGYTADQLAATYGAQLRSTGSAWHRGRARPSGSTSSSRTPRPTSPPTRAATGWPTRSPTSPVDGGRLGARRHGEAALDIEDAAGLAPSAPSRSTPGRTAEPGRSTPTRRWSTTDSPKVISHQLGRVRAEMAARPCQQADGVLLFAEAAAQGQTVVAASGDAGSDGLLRCRGHDDTS